MTAPDVTVGIMTGNAVAFECTGEFLAGPAHAAVKGATRAFASDGGITMESGGRSSRYGSALVLVPSAPVESSFVIRDVTVGLKFHWERKEDQRFTGALRLVRTGPEIAAINVVPVEDYLASVISSEMSAECSLSMLRAHAVTSRSWLLAQLGRRTSPVGTRGQSSAGSDAPGCRIRWYDREEHDLFDVCADDHCQRYQGITRAYRAAVAQAVEETRGQVLMSGGKICDARFSKSCGGITEPFENVWQPVHVPYLVNVADSSSEGAPADVSTEAAAGQWVRSSPPAFCNTGGRRMLAHVLPERDRETADCFRWKVEYGREEIAALVREKSGIDFGGIIDLIPVQRGPSGRISLLKIVGEKQTLTVGKELEIRRILSPTHLYSSAFVVATEGEGRRLPRTFILRGAGWGHGVGLCQIGAAVMGEEGYPAEAILAHYFKGAAISRLYR